MSKIKMKRIAATSAVIASFALFGGANLSARAQQNDDARTILKAMSDYVASQKSISVTFNSDIEVITPELQKIQFASSGQLELTRPEKIHVTRSGGYADVALFFDGATLTVYDKRDNVFAQASATGSVDQLVSKLRTEVGVEAPGADLLLSNVYDELTSDVIDAKHIGEGVIEGVECEHLAFRGVDTDWQIWIEAGPKPMPRKYVITSKGVAGAPQYTLLITDWKSDATPSSDVFAFKEPAGAKKVEFKNLPGVDEVPAGIVKGEKQ